MITVYTLTDGYRIVGLEGQQRYFIPPSSETSDAIIQDLINKLVWDVLKMDWEKIKKGYGKGQWEDHSYTNKIKEKVEKDIRYRDIACSLQEYYNGGQ